MTNFEYLKELKDFKELYDFCDTSESFVLSRPDISASYSRKALEYLVKTIYMIKLNYVPQNATLFELVDNYMFASFVSDKETIASLHFIRKIGNNAVHNVKTTKAQALACLENLHFFVGEILISLGVIKDYPPFDKSLIIPQKETKPTSLPSQDIVINPDDVSKYKDKIKSDTVLQIKRTMPEAETRKLYIDCWLQEAGWDVLTIENQKLPAKAGIEIEVHGMPNDKGIGFCDYVLFGRDGKPLAVVEAKKKDVSPIKGENQAQLYANCLEKEYGVRPVVYYTNGYETKIIDGLGYPSRTIYGFHTIDELEALVQKQGKREITDFNVDTNIAGRPYQIMAIRSVCDHFNKMNRKALIVMATGTGKTRVSIALVDILKRNNFIKNVLFLADRIELVNQAKKNFVKLMPAESVCVLSDKSAKKDLDARLVFSTYQTIINYIDNDKKTFGIGRFDLIIIDEAHRSIFNKYRAIFHYFDSLLVGLTATPRNEIDKNTYTTFGLDDGIPNFHYELDEAVKDRYLVSYNVYDRTSEIMKRGFKYSDLSPKEVAEIETEYAITMDGEYNLDYDVLGEDKQVSGNQLFKKFYNRDTIKKVLKELMRDGLKVNSGENIGKTIVFAPNHKTAEMVVEEFKKLYPQYGNDYCVLIDNYVTYASNLIERFGTRDKLPQIAVSVDMLDTGIDVPDVLNLVFFRAVKSKIKFLQMIGRGTRLCENIRVFSPSRDFFEGRISEPDMNYQQDKQGFYIFDYCDNFRFFDNFKEKATGKQSLNLTQRIFNMKSELIFGLQALEYQQDNFCVNYRNSLIEQVRADVNKLSPMQILVKESLQYVDKFKADETWQYLSKLDLQELKAHITELVSPNADDELAKIFDLKILNIEVSLIDKSQDSTKSQNAIIVIAQALSNMTTIPQIRPHMDTIIKLQTREFWDNITIEILEDLRKELRDLIKFIPDGEKSKVYVIDINDTITDNGNRAGVNIAGMKTYEQKVIDYLAENSNKEVIKKIKNLEKINENDLHELESILWSELGTKEDYFKFTQKDNLAVFVRSIVGLEQQAVNEKFGQFLTENVLNSRQQEFVKTIISYVRENGDVTFDDLVNNSPFDNINIIRMFGDKIYIVQKIVEQLHGAVMCA